MYRWIIRKLTRALLARLRRGDSRWLLAFMAEDVHFRFLGEHSWAADFHSKTRVRSWLDRYIQAGLQLEPHEIVVGGPPWNTIICTRFTDSAINPGGEVIYRNEGVLFDRVVWGRIREHISYEDTQRTLAFDQTLATLRDHRSESAPQPLRVAGRADLSPSEDPGGSSLPCGPSHSSQPWLTTANGPNTNQIDVR